MVCLRSALVDTGAKTPFARRYGFIVKVGAVRAGGLGDEGHLAVRATHEFIT